MNSVFEWQRKLSHYHWQILKENVVHCYKKTSSFRCISTTRNFYIVSLCEYRQEWVVRFVILLPSFEPSQCLFQGWPPYIYIVFQNPPILSACPINIYYIHIVNARIERTACMDINVYILRWRQLSTATAFSLLFRVYRFQRLSLAIAKSTTFYAQPFYVQTLAHSSLPILFHTRATTELALAYN